MTVTIRPQRVTDAQSFFDILGKQNFPYFSARPKTLQEEISFLRMNSKKRKENIAHNFTIKYGDEIVGGCGISINPLRNYNGEAGYFIDRAYWNKGIATTALKLLEKYVFEDLKVKGVEMLIHPKNKASIKVALKNNYKKESLQKQKVFLHGKYSDVFLFVKIKIN